MQYSVEAIVESRLRIAEIRNSIRNLKNSIDSDRFKIEMRAIESSGGNYGKNAEERERYLKNVLLESANFVENERTLLSFQNELELEEARFESLRDLRRDIELQQRDRAIEANVNLL
jgi:hypothetical protein